MSASQEIDVELLFYKPSGAVSAARVPLALSIFAAKGDAGEGGFTWH